MAVLEHISTGERVSLLPSHRVGRDADCSLRLDDPNVSSLHALIQWNDQWSVRDLGSSNGTSVDGKLLAVGEWCPLIKHQVISFGEHQAFVLADDSAPVSRANATPTTRVNPPLDLKNTEVTFLVTQDEEYVELRVGDITLKNQSCWYLLLVLARRKLEDLQEGIPETSCGWMHREELEAALKMSTEHINVDVFRVRKKLAELELQNTAQIIERRPRSGQLRTNLVRIAIEKC